MMRPKRQRSKGTGTLFKRTTTGPWIAKYFLWNGKRREHSTGTTCQQTATRMLV